MILTGNYNEPTKENNKNLIPDVAPEDDPSIPEEEKEKIRKEKMEKSNNENNNEKPSEPSEKNISQNENNKSENNESHSKDLITSLEKITSSIQELTTTVSLGRKDIELFKEYTKNNQEAIQNMKDNMANFFAVKVAANEMKSSLEKIKIKWDLTIKPVTQEEVFEKMQTSKWKEEYTKLNNILKDIQELKMTVENHMDEWQGKSDSPEYNELYILGKTLERVFNVWPPKLKYFIQHKNQIAEINEEQACKTDISAAQADEEFEREQNKIFNN